MRSFRAVTGAAAGLALITILAACGGGVDGAATAAANSIQAAISANQSTGERAAGSAPASSDSSAETAAETETAESAAALPPVTRQIAKTGWYDGFAITVDEVTAEQGFGDGVDVTINLDYQNLGTGDATPPDASVEVDGEIVEGLFDTPGIPGAGTAKGTAIVTVVPENDQQEMTFDDAIDKVTLVYGDAADNQTKIPLVASGAVDSVQPLDLTATGTMSQGEINIEIVSGSLVPSYESGEKGKGLLNLRVKLTCAPGCQAQGYNTGVEEFSITGPDSVSVLADSRSEYCCDALYPETVSDGERNILTFVVALPGAGAYTLTYQNPYLTSTGTPPATFGFTA
jgi:hypothetical protein